LTEGAVAEGLGDGAGEDGEEEAGVVQSGGLVVEGEGGGEVGFEECEDGLLVGS
jgi:hypothetical protein